MLAKKKPKSPRPVRPVRPCRHCEAIRKVIDEADCKPVLISTLFNLLGDCDVDLPTFKARDKLGRLESAAAKDGSAKVIGYAAGYRRALLDLRRI